MTSNDESPRESEGEGKDDIDSLNPASSISGKRQRKTKSTA